MKSRIEVASATESRGWFKFFSVAMNAAEKILLLSLRSIRACTNFALYSGWP